MYKILFVSLMLEFYNYYNSEFLADNAKKKPPTCTKANKEVRLHVACYYTNITNRNF